MRSRGREEEAGAPLDYLKNLHNVYEDWLINRTLGHVKVPILVLDANKGMEDMIETYIKHKEQICGNETVAMFKQPSSEAKQETIQC